MQFERNGDVVKDVSVKQTFKYTTSNHGHMPFEWYNSYI